jgi:hypothetical protein
MEPLHEALRLLKRQAELEDQMRRPGGIRVAAERELFALREKLTSYPAATRAVFEASRCLHRPIDQLSVEDVEKLMAEVG